MQDKLSLVKDSKDREIRGLNKKLSNVSTKLDQQLRKTVELEKDIRDNTEPTSNRVNSKYLAGINSNVVQSKTKANNLINQQHAKSVVQASYPNAY